VSYQSAAKAIRECKNPIRSKEDALKLRGIGEHIADHIREFLETGKTEKLEQLRSETD
jgi:DNA polymerase/3'-5' exonuclease PolX